MNFVFLVLCIYVFALILIWIFTDKKRIRPPSKFSVTQVRSNEMADVLTYVVTAGPAVDHDVVSRELTVVVDGGDPVVSVFAPAATDLGTVVVSQGVNVDLSLVDVDDAGNRSEPALLSFVAEDTIPPATPGSFGVTLVGEAPAAEPTGESEA